MFFDELTAFSKKIPPYLWDTLIIIFSICVGHVLKFILIRIMSFYEKRETEHFSLFGSFIIHMGRPLAYFIPLFIFNLLFSVMILPPSFVYIIKKIVEILVTISIANILINIIQVFEKYIYFKYSQDAINNLNERKIRTQLVFIRKISIVLIIIVSISIILLSFESLRKIGTGLLTSVGIGGIIIGFAAQKSLGNLLAGFQIAFTQPIRIDDVLLVEGEYGRVEEITLTYVVLNIWDQRSLILPINYFIEKPFQNWTRSTSELMGTVFIYADYTVPVEEIRKEADMLLESNDLWDKRIKVVQVTDSLSDTLQIRILMSASNSGRLFDLRCFIREKIIYFIQQKYPQSLPRTRTDLSYPSSIESAPDKDNS